MNIKQFLICIGMVSSLGASLAEASYLPLNAKVDQYVKHQFSAKEQIDRDILVVLKDQANLDRAQSLTTREEKARYVYDTLRQKAISTQGPIVKYLESKNIKFHQFYIENMIVVENPSIEIVKALSERSDVARIMGNPPTKLKLPRTKATLAVRKKDSGPEQNLIRIGATTVWDKYNVRGEGIVVAGQDTGVQWDHPALIKQYRGSGTVVNHNYNWHDAIHKPVTNNPSSEKSRCGYDSKTPCDDQGHGTHTMGTIVGDDGKGNRIGVAPKAQWMACKNMDNGNGTPASYIECFEFFLAPYPLNGNAMKDGDPSKAPHIINNSWGCTRSEGCHGDEILGSLKAVKAAGILVVASAGNDGPSCSTIKDPPAWHTGLSFSIGAFDHRTDRIAGFSSRGPSKFDHGVGPNVAAPGVSIRSSVPGNGYEDLWWSGTSMAGPHAVGAAALLWSFNKNLIGQIDQTISIFENNAESKKADENCGGIPGSHTPNNTYGYGLLNVAKAVCSQSNHCDT